MSAVSNAVRALRRAIAVCFRLLFRTARILFILALVSLPVPAVGAFVAVLLKPNRRNLPAEVLRKRG